MQSKSVVIIAALVILALVGISYFLKSNVTTAEKCFLGPEEKLVFCCNNGQDLVKCDENSVRCGQYVIYMINVTNFDLPDKFYLCSDDIKFDNATNFKFSKQLTYEYDNRIFTCISHLLQKPSDTHAVIINDGRAPYASSNEALTEIYVYPANYQYNSINDFIALKNISTKIFALNGVIKC